MDTLKKYLIATSIIITLVIFLTLAAVNFAGIGTKLGNIGGPFTSGLARIGASPLNWALVGGYQMLIFYIVAFALIPVLTAYVVWHWDIGYILSKNSAATSPANKYDNSMKREPEEPERSNAPAITK